MGFYGEKNGIPRVVRDSILFLRERGLHILFYVVATLTLLRTGGRRIVPTITFFSDVKSRPGCL
jgi:hypothetical protein